MSGRLNRPGDRCSAGAGPLLGGLEAPGAPIRPGVWASLPRSLGSGRRGGRVFSRQQLMDSLYRDHRIVSERTVDSHVKNLRRKLAAMGPDPIESVYGVGYRLDWPGSV